MATNEGGQIRVCDGNGSYPKGRKNSIRIKGSI